MKKLLCMFLVAFVFYNANATTWKKVFNIKTPAVQRLRAFGRCQTEFSEFRNSSAQKVWVLSFFCENNEKAQAVAGKFISDLKSTHNTQVQEGAIPLFSTPGGSSFIVTVNGAKTQILCAENGSALAAYTTSNPGVTSGAVSSAPYPAFTERFAWGFYGLGPFNNFHQWMTKVDGKKTKKDPIDDMKFMADHGFHFDIWLDPAKFDNSDGIQKNTGQLWMTKEAKKRGVPYSFRVYCNEGGADWTGRRFMEYMEQPAKFMQSGWHGPEQYWKRPHFSWFKPDFNRYCTVKTMEMMEPYKDDPDNRGWMCPHGELAHDTWFDMHSDYSEGARKNWVNYLKKHDMSLKELSKMYAREHAPFSDWDQIPIPEFATFSGLPGRVLSLGGKWYYREEVKHNDKVSKEHWKIPEEKRYKGLQEKWYQQPLSTKTWHEINLPGSDEIFKIFPKKTNRTQTTWFRRNFILPGNIEKSKTIYLYAYPVSFAGIHSGDNKRYHKFFINGKKAGEIGQWGALDVTKLLKPGNNEISMQVMGAIWNGRIFLSTSEPKVFPYLGKAKNRLYMLWRDWVIDAKYDAWVETLDGMRQVDPDRPIKFMAPVRFGGERWRKLATNYGGWPHFTGAGAWFYPWYKRYSFLYGLPATSELAGPCKNLRDQYRGYRFAFLAGLNGHEPVFLAQTYTRNPELRRWWIDHNTILKRMGHYDIDGPQVLLYRSTKTNSMSAPAPYPNLGQASRKLQSVWDWDLGRGTLQTIGYSFLYLDDDGLKDGKMYGHKVMIDSGNETIDKKAIDNIYNWVKAGGTFVTLPFTGRNEMLEPDSWPIKKLTGCEVTAERKPGKGSIQIKPNQNVLKSLAGKTVPDNGKVLDWIGNNHNIASFELKPGPNSKVLATYENGKPAIVKHNIGKGAVIVLGSAFWKDIQDRGGIWWPKKPETDFLADLLTEIGFEQPVCKTDDHLVWNQPFRSNNGLESVITLVNWHDDKDVEPTVTLRLPTKPEKVITYGVDGVKDVKFDWKDGVLTAKVPLLAREVKLLCAEVHTPLNAVSHWWNYQQKIWHELQKPQIDFSPYKEGKWAEPTQDLRPEAKFSNNKPGANWTTVDFNDSDWKDAPLDILNFWGADDNQTVWVRKTFTVPEKWLNQGGQIKLISGGWTGVNYQTPTKMYLNGKVLHDFTLDNYHEFDINKLLNQGENILAFEIKPGEKYLGFAGDIYLYHKMPTVKTVKLQGKWTGKNKDGDIISIEFPGKGKIKHPEKIIFIPKDWENKYQICLYMEGEKHSVLGAWVNNQMVRRHHHAFGNICDVDITNYINFGQENKIALANHVEWRGKNNNPKHIPTWDIKKIRLDLYPKKNAE